MSEAETWTENSRKRKIVMQTLIFQLYFDS